MIPPKYKGVVTKVSLEGTYTIKDVLVEIEYEGKTIGITMVFSFFEFDSN
jgi:vacuolar-type H+-ATPase catalytic subunit A/Vma1